jgi:hypothetical protein
VAIRFFIFIFAIILSLKAHSEICGLNKKISNVAISPLEKFYQSKIIATDADRMLSLLISAKSPMITSWIKKRNLDTNNPEIIAIEWRKYFALNFIINKYPHKNLELNNKIEILFDELIALNFTERNKNDFENKLTMAKDLAEKNISASPFTSDTKKKLITTLQKVKLYWPKKFQDSKYSKFPLEFFDWSLAFDPNQNEINIGLNSLNYNSESLQAAIAHELGHSIDSCRWSQKNKEEWPFTKIGECLRSISKKRDDSKLEILGQKNYLSKEELDFFKSNPTCNNTKYPISGTQADQLPENFADWFSSEVMANLKIDREFRNDLCENQELSIGSSYISNRDRLFKIYLSQPKIKSQLNEKNSNLYCHF